MPEPTPALDGNAVTKAAEAVITGIYRNWHGCALKKPERGIPAGTLCDQCNEEIKWRVAQLLDLSRP